MKSKLTIDRGGNKRWSLPNGYYHRENGPAVEWGDGYKEWWISGNKYTEQEYKIETRSRKLKQLL